MVVAKRIGRHPIDKEGKDREKPRQLATPKMDFVYKDRWVIQSPPFDEHTAMRMETVHDEAENEVVVVKVNMDNTSLLNEVK